MPPPKTPVRAEEPSAKLWDDSPVSAMFTVLSFVAVGILAFGAGQVLAPLVWRGGPAGLGVVTAVFTLVIAFIAGPGVNLLLASAFRRLMEAWVRHR